MRYCHCSQCRRGSGTAFSANARIRRPQWSLRGPRQQITEYEHKPGLFKAFCARCGSPLYARSDHDPDGVRVRLGGFEGELDVRITGYVWARVIPGMTLLSTRSRDAKLLMDYYWDTVEKCVPPEQILAAMREAGFEEPRYKVVVPGAFCEYTAKKPARAS